MHIAVYCYTRIIIHEGWKPMTYYGNHYIQATSVIIYYCKISHNLNMNFDM